MALWIDGDACPKAIKAILFKAANRKKVLCTFVANQPLPIPPSPFIKRLVVSSGFDQADDVIADGVVKNDIVITQDLELASRCIDKGAAAISPRGELFSIETIKQKLAMRDLNETLRGSGLHSGGPSVLSERDINQFANHLDRLLAKHP